MECFTKCKSLKNLDISNFKTTSLKKTEKMFLNCLELTSINLNFIGEKLTNAKNMFMNCSKLTSIDLNSLVGENIESIESMFDSCNNLQFIDFSNFNTSSVKYADKVFENINTNGELKYNSDKFNATFILGNYLSNWNIIDIKNLNYSLNK